MSETTGSAARNVLVALEAIGRRDKRTLAGLIKRGMAADAALPEGLTLLMAASHEGWLDAVHLLLASGARIDLRDSRGLTALGWAALGLHAEVVRALLHAGGDPTVREVHGLTIIDLVEDKLRRRPILGGLVMWKLPRRAVQHPIIDILKRAERNPAV